MIILNIFFLIVLICVIQGILLSLIILFIKSNNKKANIFLALLIFFISLSISTFLFLNSKIFIYFPYLFHVYNPIQFLFGPLLFFYVNYISDRSYNIQKKDILHLLPFILGFFYMILQISKGYDYNLDYLKKIINGNSLMGDKIFEMISTFYMWIYIILSYLKIKKYQDYIKNNYSTLDRINLSWLKKLLGGMIVVYSIFFIPLIMMFFDYNYDFIIGIITSTAGLSIFIMSYFIIAQSKIFTGIELDNEKSKKIKKYKSSPLEEEDLKLYYDKLIELMETEKVYLNQEITLKDLADRLNIPRQYLSQVINQYSNKTFYELINYYRVEEFKRLIKNPENNNYTILAIAYDAGFNSKATFNEAFKKVTKATPKEYIKKCKDNL